MFRVISPTCGRYHPELVAAEPAPWVLGEFTIAYLLCSTRCSLSLYSISRNTPQRRVVFSTSIGLALFAFALLMIVSYAGRRRRRG